MTTFTTQDRQDAQRTPLTEEKFYELAKSCGINFGTNISGIELAFGTFEGCLTSHLETGEIFEFARAIERAHGIGE